MSYEPTILFPVIYPIGTRTHMFTKYLYKNFHSHTMCNSLKLETIQMSIKDR